MTVFVTHETSQAVTEQEDSSADSEMTEVGVPHYIQHLYGILFGVISPSS